MKNNPVYKREMLVRSRSFRIPLIIMIFNGILAVVALLNMYQSIAQVKVSGSVRYENFLQLYAFVAALEFMLLMFIMPALTSASISGERERQTLELMLTTQMTPAQIVNGKLMSALSTLLLLIISSFPAIMMVFVFGGITGTDVVALLLCYTAVALFAGSLGICFSSAFKRSTLSTVLTYGVLVSIVGGTYFVNRFVLGLSAGRINSYAITYGIGRAQQQPTSGNFVYLLLMNPAATFYAIISGQAGSGSGVDKLCQAFGIVQKGWVMENWVLISIVLQLAVAGCLLTLAIWFVNPIRRRRKNRG